MKLEAKSKTNQYFSDTFSDFDKDYIDRKKAWDKWNAMWRGSFKQQGGVGKNVDGVHNSNAGPAAHKSQLYVNATKQAIVTAVSNIMGILFQKQPPFVVTGRGGELDEEIAKLIQKVVWYYMQQTKFPIQARRYITNAAIYGSAWGKTFLEDMVHSTIEFRPQRDILTGQVVGSKRFENTQTIPMVRFASIDPYDIWPDPEVDGNISMGKGVFHRIWKAPNSIEEKILRGIYREIDSDILNVEKNPDQSQDVRRTIEGLQPITRTMIPTMDFWGTAPREVAEEMGIEFTENELDVPIHSLLVLKDGRVMDYLLAERNELPGHSLPFVHDVWEDVGHGNAGRGICENTQGPQTALNVTVNSRLDNKATGIQQIIGANVDVLENPEEDLQFKQNWIIRVNGNPREALFPFVVPDMTAGSTIESKEFERMIEENSGVNKFVQGSESFGSNRTASGINTVFQAASRFLRDITSQMEYNLIAGTAKSFYQHIILFMPDEILVDISEDPRAPQLRQIALQNIVKDVDFIASGLHGLQLQEAELNNLIQFLQQTANPIDMQYVNRPQLLKNIYERFGFKDGDKIILTQTAPQQGQGEGLAQLAQAIQSGQG